MRRYDLVAFDVDGTLIEHPAGKIVWEVLTEAFTGDDGRNRERMERYHRGELTYAGWVGEDVDDWRRAGAGRAELVRAFGKLRLVDGARETMAALQAEGAHLAVISGTLDLLLDTLFPSHPFDEVYSNRIHFDEEGRIVGATATPFDGAGKAEALRAIAEREGFPLERTAFVGDHRNDVEAAREAGFAIAFNPKSAELEAVADAVVRARDLRAVLPYLVGR